MTDRPPFDPALVTSAVGPSWQVSAVPATGSTNADLLAEPTGPAGAVLVADSQTSGRGRLERAWSSPPGAGLLVSVRLRPAAPVATWGWLPLLVGVAVVDALAAVAPAVPATLKWPNDVLVGDRKLAGILVHGVGETVVAGLGLNVDTRSSELPVSTATSLAIEGVDVSREALLVAFLDALDGRLRGWSAAGGDARAAGLAAAYRGRCSTVGRGVRVELTGGGDLRGTAVDVDEAGRLVVEAAGRRTAVGAGDVHHLRPAG